MTTFEGDFHKESGRDAARLLWRQQPRSTGAFCCNDLMAYGVLDFLREQGAACPEALSVIGYDDDARSSTCEPPLTTVRVPLIEIARTGTSRLVEYLTRQKRVGPFKGQELFPVTLIIRQSVAKAP